MSRSTPRGWVAVGIDGSVESRVAAQYALDAAKARHLGVLVVFAYLPPWPVAPVTGPFSPSMQVYANQLVRETLAGLVVDPATRVETRVELTTPGALLQSTSKEVALMVIGQHHFSLAEQLLVGSVAQSLAADSACPVVVVPRTWRRDLAGPRPVVVTVDGRTPATSALDYAFAEAELSHCEVIALHTAPVHDLESFNSIERAAIGEVLAGHKQDHPDIAVSTLVVPGRVDDRIEDMSRGARAVVVGRPHRHRPFTLWTRSVAHAALDRSRCPLVIVPQGHEDLRPELHGSSVTTASSRGRTSRLPGD